MKKISYQVQGSAKEPYNITIALDGTNISCICDCPAGSKGSHCKHWMLVFEGGKQKYIGLDENQIAENPGICNNEDLGTYLLSSSWPID